ncbi:MAG: prolyl oligopeptidase family serine peptidase [Opitutus sp.]
MNNGTSRRLAFITSLFAIGSVVAADKIDLARTTPVPSTEQIPIADFFRPLYVEQPTINPAGTHVAALVAGGEDRRNLMVYDLASSKPDVLVASQITDVTNSAWLNNARLVFGLRFYQTYGGGMYATEIGHLSDWYPLLQQVAPKLLAVPPSSRTRPLAWIGANTMNTGQQGAAVVINSDVRTGRVVNMNGVVTGSLDGKDIEEDNQKHIEQTIVGPTEGYDAGFLADQEGKVAFGFTGKNGVFMMFRWTDGHWEKCPVNLDDVDVLGYGRTRNEVIVLGPRQQDQPRVLQFMDAATGKLGDTLLQDKTYDFYGSLYYEPGSRGIFGARFQRNGPAAAWFNDDYVKLQKILEGYFPKLIVRLIGADDGGRILLVETYSDRQPSAFYSVNLEKRSFGLLGKSRPWIDPERMQRTTMLAYKTRDGQKLDAYVTLPAGASKTNPVPLIVLPPDLPGLDRNSYTPDRTRASWDFNARAQFYASRGYAVLQPNHRGSGGYGWMFPTGDEWEYAKMADDVASATRHLLGTGVIDAKRIGIDGLGKSAYLAVAAAEADPELFRAVVAFHGTYDWDKFMRSRKFSQYSGPNYGVLTRHLGDDKKLEAMSVNGRLNQLRAAVLVGYQRDLGDVTAQSTSLLSDLGRANVPHESVAVGSERSNIYLLSNQVELYSRAEEFFAKHLKRGAPVLAVDAK